MHSWDQYAKKGKRLLARHRPEAALMHFHHAISKVPSTNSAALADLLYYHGLALYKTGQHGRAIARWVESQRHRKSGYPRKMLARYTNEFGMARQASSELDDREAFFAIHLSRYLQSKKSHSLDTRAESDMIRELIDDYWHGIAQSGTLEGMSADVKLEFFRKVVIVFPFFELPDRLGREPLVHVDFDAKKRLAPADRCTCGSGLTFKLCCGRTRGEDELLSGEF